MLRAKYFVFHASFFANAPYDKPCYVLCVMCYVLCVMCYVLCVMCYVLCVMCYVLCVMCYVLCVMCLKESYESPQTEPLVKLISLLHH